jgi:ADP-ribose pyrophosphatase YjhB (NUDIX family)
MDYQGFLPRRVLCVGAVVVRGPSVVFVRQTYGDLKGKWSIPWGFVDSDESPDSAAVREAKEEAGIDVSLDGLLGIQNHATEDSEQRLYLMFLCRYTGGAAQPDHLETDRVDYFSIIDLQERTDVIDPFCYWIALRVLRGEYQSIQAVLDGPYKPHIAFL